MSRRPFRFRDNDPSDPGEVILPVFHEADRGFGLVDQLGKALLIALLAALIAGTWAVFAITTEVTVAGVGVLEPAKVWPVRSKEPGLVEAVEIRSGDAVVAGRTLVRLDTLSLGASAQELQERLTQKKLELNRNRRTAPLKMQMQEQGIARASAALVTRRAELRDRLTQYDIETPIDEVLESYTFGSHVALDMVIANVRQSEVDLEAEVSKKDLLEAERIEEARLESERAALEVELRLHRDRLKRRTLYAPHDGVVLTERPEDLLGKAVVPGDLLLEVAEPGRWQVVMGIDQRDVRRIRTGDHALVEVDALHPEKREPLKGVVTAVANEPVVEGATRYRVVVAVEAEDRVGRELAATEFRRGYSAEVFIVTRATRLLWLLWETLGRGGGR